MVDNNFIEYIRRLHLFVESQNKKINQLENVVQALVEEVNNLKNKPSIHVDRIEYKFDQLKVETLEGTLNIGLNPTDLQKSIEDFAVNGNQPGGNQSNPENLFQSTMRIEQSVLENLEGYVDHIIQQFEQNQQVKIEDSYISFIKNDIKKQLPNRIQYHLNQVPIDKRVPEQTNSIESEIIDLIKKDIQNGIFTFLTNLPMDVKERVE